MDQNKGVGDTLPFQNECIVAYGNLSTVQRVSLNQPFNIFRPESIPEDLPCGVWGEYGGLA